MNALLQMLVTHPVISIWLALTVLLWLAVYFSTRKPREGRVPNAVNALRGGSEKVGRVFR